MQEYKYGVMIQSATNIGDEIQSISAMRFLPNIDEYVGRETIRYFTPQDTTKLTKVILNAWWMWKPKNFPPSKYIKPLLISMYFRKEIRKKFLTKETKKYLVENGPVGCRDMSTYRFLNENNIPAYFSGCLTLTLQRNPKIKRQDYILCIDVSKEIEEAIKKRTNRKVINISPLLSPYFLPKQRLEVAKPYLRLIHSAHCVVSTRLHAILPALGFETPVLRIIPSGYAMDIKGRIEGMENFAQAATEEEFITNTSIYDFENPPANRTNYLEMRQKLIEKCKEFTGYDSGKPTLEEDCNPLFDIYSLLQGTKLQNERMLYFSNNITLFKIILKRIFCGINRHNFLEYKKSN